MQEFKKININGKSIEFMLIDNKVKLYKLQILELCELYGLDLLYNNVVDSVDKILNNPKFKEDIDYDAYPSNKILAILGINPLIEVLNNLFIYSTGAEFDKKLIDFKEDLIEKITAITGEKNPNKQTKAEPKPIQAEEKLDFSNLVKVENGVPYILAGDLYDLVKLKSPFHAWVQTKIFTKTNKILVDYMPIQKLKTSTNRFYTDYKLTVNTVKAICRKEINRETHLTETAKSMKKMYKSILDYLDTVEIKTETFDILNKLKKKTKKSNNKPKSKLNSELTITYNVNDIIKSTETDNIKSEIDNLKSIVNETDEVSEAIGLLMKNVVIPDMDKFDTAIKTLTNNQSKLMKRVEQLGRMIEKSQNQTWKNGKRR